MTLLHRTAIGSCAALIALVLAGTLLLRGGEPGPFHRIDTAVTPTVAIAGLPDPDSPAGASELADLDQLAGTTLVLILLAAMTALVSLLGVIGSENLALQARRVIEVMLGAPPRRLVGGAARLWGNRMLLAAALGGVVTVAAVAPMAELAPPGITFGRPAPWAGAVGLLIVAAVVALSAVLPVQGLYRARRPLLQESESRQLTDPRPRQFNRVLLVTLQLASAAAILAGSGLFLLSGGGTGNRAASDTPADTGVDQAVVGLLVPTGQAATDPDTRAAVFESAWSALRDAPELAAESLATPGAWIGLGAAVIATNECGRCSTGGMPHPIHTARVRHHAVMPGFFAGRGLRIVEGRDLRAPGPRDGDVPEVVINQAYAYAHFQDPPVIGKRVALGGLDGEWHVVVGIVEDVGAPGLGASGPRYAVYYSAIEHPPAAVELVASVTVGSRGDEDYLRVVRESLASASGAGLEMTALEPAADELDRVYGTAAWLGGGSRLAGIVAALVSVLGMVGAITVHVASRRREMGIRGALGAQPVALRRMILAEALRIGAVGVGLGLWGAMLVVGVMGPPGVDVFNAPLFLAVGVLFLGSAVGAAWPGARLAATAEPNSVIDG
ncbi:MAG: hypothetical protein OXE96_00445 [Gemmatimonadetes bacterium]|nr:hypothetical protein [Gemmatimonadota bacterium]